MEVYLDWITGTAKINQVAFFERDQIYFFLVLVFFPPLGVSCQIPLAKIEDDQR